MAEGAEAKVKRIKWQ